jgi:trk system potassium uptake protein TrkH
VGGLEHGTAGIGGEALILVFFVFALTRLAISPMAGEGRLAQLSRDPELRIALALLVLVPSVLFLRHWLGAWEVAMVADLRAALGALWGAAFTTWSFLSTTGFLSSEWDTAQAWSGLGTTGLVLLGLGLIGGGAATTAGGVKLLRVYALYLHGAREMDRLSHPSSVGGAGPVARRLRREGAYIAWVFFMLFALSLTAVSVTLAATGVPFDEAMVLTVAALSNTGPIAGVVLDAPASFIALDAAAKIVLAAAMVLGRLETLAIIALANPAFWRR